MWTAQLCEAFPGRLPREVLAEVEYWPPGFVEEVLEARAYMQAKHVYETTERKADLPKHWPLLDDVKLIDLEEAAEAIRKKRAEGQ